MKHIYASLFLILFLLIKICGMQAKVLICTFAYNRPDFIELQHTLFKKFLRDDYEFIVFDDSVDATLTAAINAVCTTHGISYIKIPQEIHARPYLHRFPKPAWFARYHNGSVRNCNVAQYALDTIGFDHDDLVILFEADVFLIKEFSFREYMQNCTLAGYDRCVEYNDPRRKLPFLWIGLIYVNVNALPNKYAFNVNCGQINDINIDSGGHLHYYLKKIEKKQIKLFDKIRVEQLACKQCETQKNYRCTHNTATLQAKGFDAATIQFIQEVPIDWGSGSKSSLSKRNLEFLHNNCFIHFYGASGYAMYSPYCNIKQLHKDKTEAFERYITMLLSI